MSGKGKPFRRPKKGAGKPQEAKQPAAEQPAAQPATDFVRLGIVDGPEGTRIYKDDKLIHDGPPGGLNAALALTGEVLGRGSVPAKLSEEAEAVLAVLYEYGRVMPDGIVDLAPAAAALVRRFPGLTRKPGVPRPAREDAMQAKRGRLPDGSVIVAVWDEGSGTWAGQLVTEPPKGLSGMLREIVLRGGPHFATSHTGVFGLLKRLDGLYREWLGRQKGGGK